MEDLRQSRIRFTTKTNTVCAPSNVISSMLDTFGKGTLKNIKILWYQIRDQNGSSLWQAAYLKFKWTLILPTSWQESKRLITMEHFTTPQSTFSCQCNCIITLLHMCKTKEVPRQWNLWRKRLCNNNKKISPFSKEEQNKWKGFIVTSKEKHVRNALLLNGRSKVRAAAWEFYLQKISSKPTVYKRSESAPLMQVSKWCPDKGCNMQ